MSASCLFCVVTFMPGRHRRGARGGQALHAFDLHQAEAAGAEGFQLFGGAEFGDLHIGECRSAHHRGARRNGDLLTVDGQGDEFRALALRSA